MLYVSFSMQNSAKIKRSSTKGAKFANFKPVVGLSWGGGAFMGIGVRKVLTHSNCQIAHGKLHLGVVWPYDISKLAH